MKTILALAHKDLRILVRHKAGLFFTVIWPLLVAVMFGVIFSGTGERAPKIKVSVADDDSSPESEAFIVRLEKSSEFEATRTQREVGLATVRKGKQTALIVIQKGFGEASARMFYGDPPKVELWIDPSRKAESAMLQGFLLKLAAERMQGLMSDRSASKKMVDKALLDLRSSPSSEGTASVSRLLGELDRFITTAPTENSARKGMNSWQPLEVAERAVSARPSGPMPDNSFEITFPQGILWGIIGCVMTFGIGIVSERTRGTMIRLQMSPINRMQLLAGKALACFTALVFLQAGLFVIGRAAFGVRPLSWPLVLMACGSAAVAFVGIMMLVSVLGKTEQSAAGVGWAIMMPLAMLGGGMVPLFLMPAWMVTASNFSPAKWAILALEGAIWRGFSFSEMLLPCGLLVAIGLVFFVIGARAFRPTP